ncbi:MAG: helix-turn-helix domain-containing protein [Treponema sp.]|nr:helix-turn-helix domain-containing protein [Treponema sp.]
MQIGRNLADILKRLNLSLKKAAEKIGISPNTLTNIITEKTEISEKSLTAIKLFLENEEISENELYKEKIQIPNIRIRVNSELAGNEKANIQNTLIHFENITDILKEIEKTLPLIEYFSLYKSPDFAPSERRKELLSRINKDEISSPEKLADFLYQNDIKELLYIDSLIPYTPYNLPSLLKALGIRVIFISFGTNKASSFSTSFFENKEKLDWIAPTIVLNTDVCDTTEKTFFYMAYELYFMLAMKSDYVELKSYKPNIETNSKDAESFAENLLLPLNFLSEYIKYEQNWKYDKVDILKSHFGIGYTLAIKQLFKLNYLDDFSSEEEAKKEYLAQIKSYYDDIDKHLPNLNGEPNPLPLSLRGADFFECAVLAAWKANLPRFSGSETAKLLNCEAKHLEKKYHKEKYLIEAMLGKE